MQRSAESNRVLAWALFKAEPGSPDEPDPVDWQSYFLPRAAAILRECRAKGFDLVESRGAARTRRPAPDYTPSPRLAAVAAGILAAGWAAICSTLPRPLRAALMSRLPPPPLEPDHRPAASGRRRGRRAGARR